VPFVLQLLLSSKLLKLEVKLKLLKAKLPLSKLSA
jgi:hypothetical protein